MTALLALAFAAGMIAPVNPCGFALLPAWIAQTIGDARTRPLALRLAHGLRAGLALSLGFAGTLAAFGLIVSAGARTLISAAPWLGMATGVILLLLGLAMLTGLTPRLRLPAWATKPRTQEAAGAGHKTGRMVAFGIGYAAASLGCTLGVLLAVIAQAQAVASYAGLLAVFAAYAAGSATVLVLVSAGTSIAGAALGRRITGLAKHSNRIAAFILTITGAYLSWYWYPAATGGTAQANSLAVWSAAASAWISDNSTLIAALAAAVVLASALAALNRRRRLRIRQGTPPTGEGPGQSGEPDCCTPTPDNNSTEDRPGTIPWLAEDSQKARGRGNLAHLLANEAPAYQDRLVQRHQAGSQFVRPCSSSETTIRIASGRAIDAAAEAQVWVVDGSYYQEGESEAVG